MSNSKIRTEKFATLAVLAGLLLVSACDTLMGVPSAPQPCPAVSILGDAATITRFVAGQGRDLIDIDYTGEIINQNGKCSYEYDEDSGGGVVTVTVNTDFEIERGAGNRDRQATFQYVVSIVYDNGYIPEPQVFSYTAKYWKNRNSIKDRDAPIILEIPLADGMSGGDFEIYVGFQLSQEELDYNREKLGR